MAIVGNTIKLRVEFLDFNGNLCDPENIELRIYDNKKRIMGEPIAIDSTYRVEEGIYEYPFVVPNGAGQLFYEFTGIIEGNPTVGRGVIDRTWY